jgi:hypothetical protein
MRLPPRHSPPPRRPAPPRRGRRLLAAGAALLAALGGPAGLAAPARGADSPFQARPPGQEVVLGDCLRVAVLGFTDRNGPLEPADWVTVKLSNGCPEPVRDLLVDLYLVDSRGQVYGAPLWLLQRGELLRPGHVKTERYAVPDGADHRPRQWAVRLRSVDKPSLHRHGPVRPAAPRG